MEEGCGEDDGLRSGRWWFCVVFFFWLKVVAWIIHSMFWMGDIVSNWCVMYVMNVQMRPRMRI